MVGTVVTVPEGELLVVVILSSPDIKALSVSVSEVVSVSSEPNDSLISLLGKWSDDNSLTDGSTGSILVGNNIVSSVFLSEGSGSGVEVEERVFVLNVEVLDSKSVLVSVVSLSNSD